MVGQRVCGAILAVEGPNTACRGQKFKLGLLGRLTWLRKAMELTQAEQVLCRPGPEGTRTERVPLILLLYSLGAVCDECGTDSKEPAESHRKYLGNDAAESWIPW